MSGSVLSLVGFLDMSSSETAGSSIGCIRPVPSPMTLAFDHERQSRHFQHPHPPILVGNHISRLHYGSLSLRPVDLLALLSEQTGLSRSHMGVYCRAFGGLVTRPAADYNYGGNWIISTGGTFTR